MSARFNIKAAEPEAVACVQRELHMPHFIAATLVSRGIDTPEAANRFLTPSLDRDWRDPYTIPGLSEAADALEAAIRRGDHILVFGDFDLDGISATTVMTRGLREFGARVTPFIPRRFEEGYAITPAAIERLSQVKPDFLVTVDCGIACKAEVRLLQERGIEVAVTDHHEPSDLVPEGGRIIANRDDANTMRTLEGESHPVTTFGLEAGDVHAAGLIWERGLPAFDVVYRGETFAHVSLRVPGVHNVKNALAAAAASIALGVPARAVEEGLNAFRGAGRRLEHKGSFHGAEVFDDYAHHPGELKALLDTARTLGYERVICAFQPHTYTRTAALFDDFAEVLKKPDVTLLAEIFAARETNDIGISSRDLAEQIPGAEYYATLPEVTARLRELARPGDLILTVGAGDIYTAGEALVRGE